MSIDDISIDTARAFEAIEAGRFSDFVRAQGWKPEEVSSRIDLAGREAYMDRTALAVAASRGTAADIELLVPGSQIDARDVDDNTPLILAAMSGSAEGCSALLRLGADPAARCEMGFDALGWAAKMGQADACKALMPCCDPKTRDERGMTPLMLAATSRYPGALEAAMALAPSSELGARDQCGESALDHAKRCQGNGIEAFLRSQQERESLETALARSHRGSASNKSTDRSRSL